MWQVLIRQQQVRGGWLPRPYTTQPSVSQGRIRAVGHRVTRLYSTWPIFIFLLGLLNQNGLKVWLPLSPVTFNINANLCRHCSFSPISPAFKSNSHPWRFPSVFLSLSSFQLALTALWRTDRGLYSKSTVASSTPVIVFTSFFSPLPEPWETNTNNINQQNIIIHI